MKRDWARDKGREVRGEMEVSVKVDGGVRKE